MQRSAQSVEMEFEASGRSPERNLWSEVIGLMLWDYAHFRREVLQGPKMSVTRQNKYRRIRYAVFGRSGSLVYIASLLHVEPEGLIDGARRAVSDERINEGYVLGRKMRDDDPDVKPRTLAELERREGE